MTEQPLVSIIIPTYNRAELIGETLDSILAQTYQNWECIVVDDGSTDHTSDVLDHYTKKDSRISYHHRPKQYNPGGNGARNYGFDISKGEYINWFDSDDVMLENFILEKINSIENNDFIICSHNTIDNKLNLIKQYEIILEKNILYDYLEWHDNFNVLTPSILFKKSFLGQNKFRFNETILRGQEAEFLLNIFSKKYNDLHFKIINKPLFLYRQHLNSKTSKDNFTAKKYNYSLLYVNVLKCKLVKQFQYNDLRLSTFQRLEKLMIKFQQQNDFKNTWILCKEILSFKTIKSTLISICVLLMFFAKKTPKIITNHLTNL
ncbi:glycosyltransferase [Empedobacter falsenii]|uniref:Glycosyltransferase n=1 Tax=Empedobacter falsenii TaxID=343874 RepID=A0ABY8VC97_9FLAO|nr:glycosyltransferase family 2 protein [Empedobacter falsenii]WIH98576.1 glycosyltransferase [Empedobacter falsenii]